MIINQQGKVNPYIHLVDLRHFGVKRVNSCYIAEFDDSIVLMDCGSSIDVKKLIRYIKNNDISLDLIKYIVISHHHFDHIGGISYIYDLVKSANPDVKILCNRVTKDLIINYKEHFNRARKAYGWVAGKMKPVEESAFDIIEDFPYKDMKVNDYRIIDSFHKNAQEYHFTIINTPGHCPNHACPLFIKNGKIDFIYVCEALGTFWNSTDLVTYPSSMPPDFCYSEYIDTAESLKKIAPNSIGYAHFGVIKGFEDVRQLIEEHLKFMKKFRNLVIKLYAEVPETKYLVDKLTPLLKSRTDLTKYFNHPVLVQGLVGVIYGMMIDLNYRHS
jgi:glyoxylase-like metal-dependent hydrolase (beta-lactamase superfamily II)